MHSMSRTLTQRVKNGWQSAVGSAARVQRLLAFGFYLVLWSKVFKGHPFLEPVEEALLATKSVHRLPPELDVCDRTGAIESWSRGFAGVHAGLFLNLHNPDALSPARYAQPAPSFRAIYLWDSAFIAQIWKVWDPEVAWDVLRSVIEVRHGDRLQHYASDFARSSFTQPPLLAWSFVQLEHVVERACLLARDRTIEEEDLVLRPRSSGTVSLEESTLEEAERYLIQRALGRAGGNVSDAARALGLSRSALYRRLQHYGLKASG